MQHWLLPRPTVQFRALPGVVDLRRLGVHLVRRAQNLMYRFILTLPVPECQHYRMEILLSLNITVLSRSIEYQVALVQMR